MKEQETGSRTLLLSLMFSVPGVAAEAMGLLVGHSSTQIADCVRRGAELLSILVSYLVYRFSAETEQEKRGRLERRAGVFSGLMMIVGGSSMLLLAFLSKSEDKGNVIPAFLIALAGAAVNFFFWRRYAGLNRERPDAIMAVQERLYRAKTLVDCTVTAALLSVVLAPGSLFSRWLDMAGSVTVAAYLIWSGLKAIQESR